MPIDELERLKLGARPQNCAKRRHLDAYVEAILRSPPEAYREIKAEGLRLRNHSTLAAIQKKQDLTGLRTIAVVRSPYGLVVSWANHLVGIAEYKRSGRRMAADADSIRLRIDEGLEAGKLGMLRLSDAYRGLDGRIAVEALRFERLKEDFDGLVRSLGIADPIELPHVKQGLGLSSRDAFEMMRTDQREQVARIFAEDIAQFGEGLE